MNEIRIATRGSRLALAQAHWVGDRLKEHYPSLSVDYLPVSTSGDADHQSSITQLSEVGAFVRAVQEVVLAGEAQLAVHSLKDLPVGNENNLVMVYPVRGPAADVLCGPALTDLPAGARVGTSSPRRSAQLTQLRPDLHPVPIRGNVDTRLDKLDRGEYDAVVVAEAGLLRLGRTDAIRQQFSWEEMVPAPGQGALAVECRPEVGELVAVIDHLPTRRAVETERELLRITGAGCRSALGAYALAEEGELAMVGFVSDERGPRRASASGESADVVAQIRNGLGL